MSFFSDLLLASDTAKTPASLVTRNTDNQIAPFDEASYEEHLRWKSGFSEY
jgi:hypothetical protein